MMMSEPLLKGELAKQYNALSGERDEWLDAACVFSALTTASAMPQESRATPNNRVVPHNNLGAMGVITLASKLTLQMIPPNQPFYRMTVKPESIQEVVEAARSQGPESEVANTVLNEIQESLVDLEQRIQQEVGRDNIRANTHEIMLQLLVSGNVVFYVPEEGPTAVFDLRQFVVQRDPMGTPLQLIVCEDIAVTALSEEQHAAYMAGGGDAKGKTSGNQEINPAPMLGRTQGLAQVYTGVEMLDQDKYLVWQEINGQQVKDSEKEFAPDEVPYMDLRWRPTPGEHYSHAYVADLEGDLRTLEGLSRHGHGFGQRRVWMNAQTDVFGITAHFNRQADFGN